MSETTETAVEAPVAEAAAEEETPVEPNDDNNDDDKITPQKKD